MDKDRVEGKTKDIAGRVKRQVGEWTGDEKTQSEGAAEQAEGKVQNAWGNVKDKVKDAVEDVKEDVNRKDRKIRKDEDAA